MEANERPLGAQRPATGAQEQKEANDRTLSDTVYEQVLAKIARGDISVGGKLPTEHELSESLGVSRPILRQALKQLRSDGVIVSRQGSGSYVQKQPDQAVLSFAPIGSIADIQRTFEFRMAIEGEAAYLAAERRSPAQLNRLHQSLEELERCVRQGELGVDADEDFHAAICAASENHYFASVRNSMHANIMTGLNLTRNLSLTKSSERLRLVQIEHEAILEAIEQRDCEAARNAMRSHIDNARKRVFVGD